jgi:hypothetical protein
VAAAVLVLLFPRGTLSTLAHDILRLPGPGGGIAIVVGPLLLLAMLVPALGGRRTGIASVAAFTFALVCFGMVGVLRIGPGPAGGFGSPLFVPAALVPGVVIELLLPWRSRAGHPRVWRSVAASAAANLWLLVFYWLVVFPQTARWLEWREVPVLAGLALGAGAAAGYLGFALAWLVWGRGGRTVDKRDGPQPRQ